MSLIPMMFDYNPWEFRPRLLRDYDAFGFGITPNEIRALVDLPRRISSRLPVEGGDRIPPPIIGKDGFQACVDVQQFKPNEITVKTVDDSVVIEGKHEDRQDEHGYISRHFVRKYSLPKGYDPKQVISTLSSDGILTVSAPPPQNAIENERVVQIQQTGPAHFNVKENSKVEAKK